MCWGTGERIDFFLGMGRTGGAQDMVCVGAGKAEEEGGGPKTGRGFFVGQAKGRRKERDGRSGWRERVVVFSLCFSFMCV